MTNSEKTRRWLEKNPGYQIIRRGLRKKQNGPNMALLRWRMLGGLNQREAARRFGVTQAAYSDWETGATRTPQRVMDDIKSAAPGAGTPKAAKKESNT